MTFDHHRAPFTEACVRYANANMDRLSTPGHQAGLTMFADLTAVLGHDFLQLDVPMNTDGVDYGAKPTPLDRSLELAADAWGAKRTWFMSNGASQANQLACLTLSNFGDTIVLQRSMHSSIIDGLAFTGMSAHYVMPSVDSQLGVPNGITPTQLDTALTETKSAGKNVAAAYIVSPSYFGAVSDIKGLADVAHSHGVPLVVDEAWGAHFGFHETLPQNSLRLGADIVVSSTHKLAGSLSQTAMFHLGHSAFAAQFEPMVERSFRSLQSTSVNSQFLISLDLARKGLMTQGPTLIPQSVAAMQDLRSRLNERFADQTDRLMSYPDVVDTDPLKVVVNTLGAGISGYEARTKLFREFGIHTEMATNSTVVMLAGAGVVPDIDRAVDAFMQLPTNGDTAAQQAVLDLPQAGEQVMLVRDAFFANTEMVSAKDAVGRVSADSLAAYPPGIPNMLPGEVITRETVDFLQATLAAPFGMVRGAASADLSSFRVVAR